MSEQRDVTALPLDAARKRAESVRQWADLNGGELDWLVDDETVRAAVEEALWLAPDVEMLANEVELLRKELLVARSSLNWIVGFAESHEQHHTGFTHIRRHAEMGASKLVRP